MPEENKVEVEPAITSTFRDKAVGTGGTGSSTPPPQQHQQQQQPRRNPSESDASRQQQWGANRF